MSIKFYGFWRSLAAYRVRVSLKLKGLAYEEIPVNLLAGEQHDPAYLAINPQGAVPALVIEGAFKTLISIPCNFGLFGICPPNPVTNAFPAGG